MSLREFCLAPSVYSAISWWEHGVLLISYFDVSLFYIVLK